MPYTVMPSQAALGQLPLWDLSQQFYNGIDDPDFAHDMHQLKLDSESFNALYRNKLGEVSAQELAEAIDGYRELKERQEYFTAYGDAAWCLDLTGNAELREKIQNAMNDAGQELLFFEKEIVAIPQVRMDTLMQNPDVEKYQPWIEKMRLHLPYQVSEEQAKALGESEKEIQTLVKNYIGIILGFEYVVDEVEYKVPQLNKMRESAAPDDRQIAEAGINQFLSVHGKELFDLYHQATTLRAANLQAHDYPDATTKTFLDNGIEPSAVKAMFTAIDAAAPETAHLFMTWKARELGYADGVMPSRDALAPLLDMPQDDISFEQAETIVLSAWRKFSPDLAEIIESFFDDERTRIDARPLAGRRQLNACISFPPHEPLVFLNYRGGAADVRGLAHELGHGAHHALAVPHGILGAQIPPVIAETASIFSELLVLEEMLLSATDDAAQTAMIADAILTPVFLNTAVMSGRFKFEAELFKAESRDELTPELAGQRYLACQQQTYGPAVSFGNDPLPDWLVAPTFMPRPFNTYPYTVGFMFSAALFGEYKACETPEQKQEFADKFADALKAGGTKSISELAAGFGFDVNNPDFWQKGLSYIGGLVGRLTAIKPAPGMSQENDAAPPPQYPGG